MEEFTKFFTVFIAGQMFSCMALAVFDALVLKRGMWVYTLGFALGAGIVGSIVNVL